MSIPQPQKDEHGKVIGDFYPLQRAELIALRKTKLINNAAYVHLALRYENPYCDRPIEILPKEFAMRWQMPESSVYEAIGKLKEEKVIEIKYGKVVIQWVHSQEEDVSGNPESAQPTRIDSEFSERSLNSQKKLRNSRKKSEIPEKQPPEPLPQADSKTPQTFSDSLDLNQTTTNTDNVAAAEKEIVPEPNSQKKQPTQEEVKTALQNVADLSPEIKISATVKKYVMTYWANFPLALAAVKEAIKSGSLKNPTGFFIDALKNPVEPPEVTVKPSTRIKKEWKHDDDWSQHPEYERWLEDAYRGRWQWVNEPGLTKTDRIPRGYFLEWCEVNNVFSIFGERGKT